jgi:uncharacterized protein (UPF0264 family)
MPKLLVSVRNAEEAQLALDAGVDLIDIKEPSAGALGAASAKVIGEIVRLVDGRHPTSAACGELIESATDVVEQLREARFFESNGGGSLSYVKVGLSGCSLLDDWPQKWRKLLALLPPKTIPVAVIYADWRTAHAPPPEVVVEHTKSLPRSALLIDTFDKSGPGLLRLWSIEEIRALIDRIRQSIPVVVAGQLTLDDAAAISRLGPDYIGVRGGVCQPNRTGHLDPQRMVEWRRVLGLVKSTGRR